MVRSELKKNDLMFTEGSEDLYVCVFLDAESLSFLHYAYQAPWNIVSEELPSMRRTFYVDINKA